MIDIKELNPEFITDKEGNKKAVVLSISDFRELMEDLEDLAVIAERRNEPTISHEDLLAELKNDGLL
jgi:PHD/YefM family antitoxin component YafN of YafNO toxin-antitoxin module